MTRHTLAAFALVLVLFGVGYGVSTWLFRAPAEHHAPPLAAAQARVVPEVSAAPRTIVTALSGLVELRNAPGNVWQPLDLNHELKDDDALRTSKGAHAELSLGATVRLEVSEQSEFTLSDVSDELSQLRLEGGRIAARVSGDGASRLRVDVRGSDAVAESDRAAFSMLRRPDGQVTVATSEGSVALRARHKEVLVAAGEQSIVALDQPPSPPRRIPASLFLKVTRLGPSQTNRRETELGGLTTPGAAVSINGSPISADGDGHFSAKVPLREGKNAVVVTVQDAMGRSQQTTLAPIHVDTRPPKLGGEVVW
jgi:hypothetical protein